MILSPNEWQVIGTSLWVAFYAVLWSLPLAIATAFALSRPRFPGKLAFEGVTHLPIILPPVLVGFLLLMMLGRRGPIGGLLAQAGISLAFTAQGAVLATAVMIFPVFVRGIRSAFEATNRDLFEAAAVLGAGPVDRFVSLALPLAWPGILAGIVMAFATALGEFGAVITFAANIPGQTQTIPLAIYAALQQPGGDRQAMRLAACSIILALLGLAAAAFLQRRAARRLAG